jgi:hypothetical protein
LFSGKGEPYSNEFGYGNAWSEANKAQALDYKINPKFLKMFRKASGRDK